MAEDERIETFGNKIDYERTKKTPKSLLSAMGAKREHDMDTWAEYKGNPPPEKPSTRPVEIMNENRTTTSPLAGGEVPPDRAFHLIEGVFGKYPVLDVQDSVKAKDFEK